jgi:hypothetical protein
MTEESGMPQLAMARAGKTTKLNTEGAGELISNHAIWNTQGDQNSVVHACVVSWELRRVVSVCLGRDATTPLILYSTHVISTQIKHESSRPTVVSFRGANDALHKFTFSSNPLRSLAANISSHSLRYVLVFSGPIALNRYLMNASWESTALCLLRFL